MEYKRTEDFPASTKLSPYITSKNTAAVCNKPTIIKCFQYFFAGIPNPIMPATISKVTAPTINRRAVNIAGPIYARPAFIGTQPYPHNEVINKIKSHIDHFDFIKNFILEQPTSQTCNIYI